MVRCYGWAPRGERCRVAVPHGHWKTITVTAALRLSGAAATALFDGATNGERVRAYVTDTLVPVLKRGDTVVMDNLGAHKVAECARGNPGSGRQGALPSTLLARLQPDRTGLRQTEGRPA